MNTHQQSGVKRHSMTAYPCNSEASDVSGDIKQARKETQTPTRMAIIADDYPKTRLDDEVTGKIKQHLWLMLNEKPISTVTWVGLRSGFISVICSGKDAINWLKCINGVAIGEVKVKVVYEKDIPRAVRMIWKRTKINDEVSIADELDKLQKLHPKLFTGHWMIKKTQMMGPQTWSKIWMDQGSADVIRDAGYELHAGLEPSYFEVYTPKKRVSFAGGSGVSTPRGPAAPRKKLNRPEEMLDVQIIEQHPNPTSERLDGFPADFSGLGTSYSKWEDDGSETD